MYNSNCSFENGGIAQLARACGSYPQCPRFESRCRYHKRRSLNTAPFIRPVGQAVKTPPFHGGNMGSIPVRVTKKDSLYLQRIQGFFFIYQCFAGSNNRNALLRLVIDFGILKKKMLTKMLMKLAKEIRHRVSVFRSVGICQMCIDFSHCAVV